jgi:hypothetical protein
MIYLTIGVDNKCKGHKILKLSKVNSIMNGYLLKLLKWMSLTITPLTGYLLAHSKDRDEIYDQMVKIKGLTLVTYSEDELPKGYTIIL